MRFLRSILTLSTAPFVLSQASSLLYRLTQDGVIPSDVQPNVCWWITLGQQDLEVDGCSLDTVHSGLHQVVQQILQRNPNAKIILSPPTSDDQVLHKDWNDRLRCVADSSTDERVEFYDPFHAATLEEEEDDDFFVDVSSGGSVAKTATPEEALQAVVSKVIELRQ